MASSRSHDLGDEDLYFAKCLLSAVFLFVRMHRYNGGMPGRCYMGSKTRGYSLRTPAVLQEPELTVSSSSLFKVWSEAQQPRAVLEPHWRHKISALPLAHFLLTSADIAGAYKGPVPLTEQAQCPCDGSYHPSAPGLSHPLDLYFKGTGTLQETG